MDGFAGFITSWVYTGGPVVIVDVGPSATSGDLLDTLKSLGIHKPDYILLTHIHLDHSGAIGQVSAVFEGTPVVCHPKAVEHLIDPRKLWEGSVKTLGDVARQYGSVAPVCQERILAADKLRTPDIQAIATPGHAPHHYSYHIGDLLFAGEVGGVCIALDDGNTYIRPATPPRLFLETYIESIDRAIALDAQRLCYGHIGMHPASRQTLEQHREQLLQWRDWIQPWFQADPENRNDTMNACLEDLLAKDPLLAHFGRLSSRDQSRERFFLRNSVRGYWGFLKDCLQ